MTHIQQDRARKHEMERIEQARQALEAARDMAKQVGHVPTLTQIDAALASLEGERGAVRVKALEWETERGYCIGPSYKAVGGNIGYRILDNLTDGGGRYEITTLGVNSRAPHLGFANTLEAAKAAAQADYERRIRSALEPDEKAGGEWRLPKGWKLVPETPTEEMIGACVVSEQGYDVWHQARIDYAAMLASAPTPPALEGGSHAE